MIFKTASAISPDVEVAIDNVVINYLSLQRISMEERENQHPLMVLDFTGLAPEHFVEYIDRPVRVSIQFPNIGGSIFIGYVAFLEPLSVTNDGLVNNSPFQVTRFYCLGASYIMKSKKSRTWDSVTLSDIAVSFANSYKLSVSVPNDSFRFKRLAQVEQSDWSFLVMVANRLGYSVTMEGTHIHIWDPFKTISRQYSFGILKTIKGLNGNVSPGIGQVLRFEGRVGAVTTSAERTPDTLHVLDSNGVLSTVGGSLLEASEFGQEIQSKFSNTIAVNADSYDMGYRLVTGRLRKKFSLTATVDITGNPTLHPGGVVNLEKYDAKFDGFWGIHAARHEITNSELLTTLELVKDSTNEAEPTLSNTAKYIDPPASSLLNGEWVSERQWNNIYS